MSISRFLVADYHFVQLKKKPDMCEYAPCVGLSRRQSAIKHSRMWNRLNSDPWIIQL